MSGWRSPAASTSRSTRSRASSGRSASILNSAPTCSPNPELWPDVFEETLRWLSPLGFVPRGVHRGRRDRRGPRSGRAAWSSRYWLREPGRGRVPECRRLRYPPPEDRAPRLRRRPAPVRGGLGRPMVDRQHRDADALRTVRGTAQRDDREADLVRLRLPRADGAPRHLGSRSGHRLMARVDLPPRRRPAGRARAFPTARP